MRIFFEYLINNNLPSLIVSVLAFIVSITGTLVIPWCKDEKEKEQLQQELDKFKKMLVEEYLEEFTELIDEIFETKSYLLSDVASQLEEISGKKTKRLKYMLENELIYLSSKNQFKLIRMTEFTMAYFTNTQKILEVYSPNLDRSKSEEIKIKELKRLTDNYHLKIEEYANLETDYLVGEDKMERIKRKLDLYKIESSDTQKLIDALAVNFFVRGYRALPIIIRFEEYDDPNAVPMVNWLAEDDTI